MKRILLLSGTPASGKDAVTDELLRFSPVFSRFRKHKAGTGGRQDATYVHVMKDVFEAMVRQGAFAQWHGRYGRGYGISWSELDAAWAASRIPIIHNGKQENVRDLMDLPGVHVWHVLLLSGADETRQRLATRAPSDEQEISARMTAYEAERDELADLCRQGTSMGFDLCLNTDRMTPALSSEIIAVLCQVAKF